MISSQFVSQVRLRVADVPGFDRSAASSSSREAGA